MKSCYALVATTILALPPAAKAQPVAGPYIGAGAGIKLMQQENTTLISPLSRGDGQLTTGSGPAASLSLGYGWGNGLRTEVEGDFRYKNFNAVGGTSIVSGIERKYGPMINVLYDFASIVPLVQPYIGAGAGYQWSNENNLQVNSPGVVFKAGNETKGNLAYQAILGAALPVAAVPGLSLTADYRFMGVAGDRTYSGTINLRSGHFPASVAVDSEYNHTIIFGFRYAFGAAPAPATVASPATVVSSSPVSRSYMVVFDLDKAEVTVHARHILSEAATNSTKIQYTRLELNGYTDRTAASEYSQGLSRRRAQAVAAELVRDGVPNNAITIQGFGETHQWVATGTSARDPQYRGVDIIIK